MWTESYIVSALHPQVSLPDATKDAIVAAAKNYTSQDLPYWNPGVFALIPAADVLFVASGGTLTPRLNVFLSSINSYKNSTSTFICSTLVWRAYWDGTSHALDISTPNNMSPEPGSLISAFSTAFINQLDPVFVVPQTFALSPKLVKFF